MTSTRAALLSLFASALLLTAEPSLAQKSLGIAATQLGSDFRQEAGKRLTFICPASDGAKAVVYGTETYADFSMICPAAIHAGILKPGRAGAVSIVLGAGAAAFKGSERNGVKSLEYGRWDHAFTFARDAEPGSIMWTTGWSQIPAGFADPVVLSCPAGGRTDAVVWGTDSYTVDSAICVAAVHAGVISPKTGGQVTVTRTQGLKQYVATERHSVASRGWGAAPDAFSVKAAIPPAEEPPAASLAITTSALPEGISAVNYASQITATAGSGTGFSWQVTAGTLPAGIAVAPTGTPSTTLSGTPTTSGTYNFTVQVTDSAGVSDDQAFSLTVGSPASGGGFAARIITLAGFTGSGTQPISGPRTVTLAGFTAEGTAPVAGPRTITLVGWTAAGP